MTIFSVGNLVEPIVPLVIDRYIPAQHVMKLIPHRASLELINYNPARYEFPTFYPITCKITKYDLVPYKWSPLSETHIAKRFKKMLAEGWDVVPSKNFDEDGIMEIKKGNTVYRTVRGVKDYNIIHKSIHEGLIIPPYMLRGYITQICAEGEVPLDLKTISFDPPLWSIPKEHKICFKIFTEEYLYYYLNINLTKLCE